MAPPCLVSEFCPRGSLYDTLKEARKYPPLAKELTWVIRLRMVSWPGLLLVCMAGARRGHPRPPARPFAGPVLSRPLAIAVRYPGRLKAPLVGLDGAALPCAALRLAAALSWAQLESVRRRQHHPAPRAAPFLGATWLKLGALSVLPLNVAS
jgi:hypothetical protein